LQTSLCGVREFYSGGGNHGRDAFYFSVYILLCLGAHASEPLPIGAVLPSRMEGGVKPRLPV
jgi:hypothetical protein